MKGLHFKKIMFLSALAVAAHATHAADAGLEGLSNEAANQLNNQAIANFETSQAYHSSGLAGQTGNPGWQSGALTVGSNSSFSSASQSISIGITNNFADISSISSGGSTNLSVGGVVSGDLILHDGGGVSIDAPNPPPNPSLPNIDTAQPYYLSSGLGQTVNPAFQGGTLRVDVASTYPQNFTILFNGSIDAFGLNSTFPGVFSDANIALIPGGQTFTFPGNLKIMNSGTGGSVTLTGANTYTGSTTINNGATLALSGLGSIAANDFGGVVNNGVLDISGTNSGASIPGLSGNGVVNLGAQTLTLTNGHGGDFSGTITGSGGLNVNTFATYLSGTNTYTGATTINGSLAISNTSSIANSSEVVVNGDFFIGTDVSIKTLSGNVSGDINLGAQTLTLTNASGVYSGNFYGTGGLTIAGGVQTIDNPWISYYSGLTTINNGASLVLAGPDVLTYSSVVNDGTFELSGTDYWVRNSIQGLAGSGLVKLGGRSLKLNNATGTYSGNITGDDYSGFEVVRGTETLTGNNSFTGTTIIGTAGTLRLSGNGSIANSQMANDGVFDISTAQAGSSIQSLNGGGLVNLGAQTLTLTHASGIYSGNIDGTGGLTIAGGTETLSDFNAPYVGLTYTGLTTINPGATLALEYYGDIHYSSGVVNNGVFDISAINSDYRFINNLSGSGVVNLGEKGLTLNNASGTFSGTITGDFNSALLIANGTETLTGDNSFTGTTIIGTAGTLRLSGNGSIANSSLTNNGVFDISATLAGSSIQTLNGSGQVNLGAQTLTLTNASGSYSGNIDGTGGLTIAGGTETLTGFNAPYFGLTYTGLTTINPGATLALADYGDIYYSSGVVNNGVFDISAINSGYSFINNLSGSGEVNLGKNTLGLENASGTFSGNINGDVNSGFVIVNGTKTLTGQNSNYSGFTDIFSGATLALGGSGSIANSTVWDSGLFDISGTLAGASLQGLYGEGVVNLGAQTLTLNGFSGFSGNITGTGGLTVNSFESMGGTNAYTGLTTINNGGSLSLVGVGSIAQSSAVVNNGWFDIAYTNTGASIRSLAGNGWMHLGDQTLTLTHAADTFSGSIFGDFHPSGDLFLASGGLVLAGGTETLSGFGFLGNTTVQQGTLAVNGYLYSPVTVDTAGTLRGTGTIYGPITVNGTLAPGNSPGTLTTFGTVTMNNSSVFKSEIDGTGTGNGAGNYSRLVVTGAGNQFIVNGASLNTVFRGIGGNANNNFTPQLGQKFNIVTAEGGIVGRFAHNSLTGLNGNTRLDAFYNVGSGNNIELIATPSSYDGFMALTGSNGNARSVGGALDRMRVKNDVGWTTPHQDQLLYSVANLNAVQLPRFATALAGEVHGAMAAAAPDAGRWLQTALARQLSTAAREGEEVGIKPGDNLWFDFNASQGRTDGDAYASSYGYSRYQFAIGGDVLHSQANRFGLGVTYASTSVAPNTGSGKLYETAPFIYGQYALGKEKKVYIDGLFAYGFTNWETERANPLYTTGPLKTNASGSNIAWAVGVRSPFEFESFTVEPFLRVLWQNSNRGSATEGIASPSALGLGNYSQNGTRLLVGAAFGSDKHDPLAASLTYRASVAFGNDFGELIRPYVQAGLAGEAFQIASPHVGRQFAQLNLSGTYRVIDNTYAYVGLNGEARENRLDGSVNAGFNLKF